MKNFSGHHFDVYAYAQRMMFDIKTEKKLGDEGNRQLMPCPT
jgi:hypothetical protein